MTVDPRPERAATGPGILFLVVGPSGAGKDSLIRVAQRRLAGDPRFVFARRTITRPTDAGGEAHFAVTPEEFARLESTGGFSLSWRAHGLAYGLPNRLSDDIAAGHRVVANVSRSVIDEARRRFPHVRVVLVTASLETLRRRLAKRGREAPDDVAGRLSRAALAVPPDRDTTVVCNDGSLETALDDFLAALKAV